MKGPRLASFSRKRGAARLKAFFPLNLLKTQMIKHTLSALILSISAALLAASGAQAAPNPFTNVPEVKLEGAAEAAYIQEKTDKVFGIVPKAAAAAPAPFSVPDGWTQVSRKAYGQGAVETYAAENGGKNNSKADVLFLHGGGYVGGLHDRYRNWGLHLGDVAGAGKVYELDYRTSPAHPYPAALEDALAAYAGLLKDGMDPAKTVLVGDSAGGNLASALAVALRDKAMPLPRAIILISPWNDAGAQLPSRTMNFKKDRILGEVNRRLGPEIFNPSFALGMNKTDPLISPVNADLAGLPPMLVTAGGHELLLDDAALFAAHAMASGVSVRFKVYPGMSHDWTILLPELKETKQHERDIRAFVNEVMSGN